MSSEREFGLAEVPSRFECQQLRKMVQRSLEQHLAWRQKCLPYLPYLPCLPCLPTSASHSRAAPSFDRSDPKHHPYNDNFAQWWLFGCPHAASAGCLDASCHNGAASSLFRDKSCIRRVRPWPHKQASGRMSRLVGTPCCNVGGTCPNANSHMTNGSDQNSTSWLQALTEKLDRGVDGGATFCRLLGPDHDGES